MSYSNTTSVLANGLVYLESQVDTLEDSFGKSAASRLINGPFIPGALITGTLDTIIGVVSGFAAIAFSKNEDVWKFSMYHLNGSRKVLSNTYFCLIRTINPNAVHIIGEKSKKYNPSISITGNGFISEFVSKFLNNIAKDCYQSDSFFKQHVVSRLTFVALALSMVIARVADAAIAVFVVPTSLVLAPFGDYESVNNLAYRTLQAPGIIQDLFYCTGKFFNPWAGVSS